MREEAAAELGYVYDAEAIDAYIAHLHARIASLNVQLHDANARARRAEAIAAGEEPPDDTQPSYLAGARALAEEAPEVPPEADTTGASLHDQFWGRDNHLEDVGDDSFWETFRE